MPGAGVGGDGELVFNGYRVSVGKDEKALEMYGGDGCTTMWIYLTPQNSMLKNVLRILLKLLQTFYIFYLH